ncbi:conserved hypothetical protein [Coccidioides posadasii str. Silveira]|uniref:Uncharacterized protein n=1 Tax=Coccidioides posadasii (strain RMSCC 757 / Silveira) TaxID=443226 RepID=E9DED2_COCPS|nr:conserved hypothetical protein [Coccidioides posadasii str. Silveira]
MGSASKGPKRSVYGKNPPPRTIEQRRLRARSNWDRLFGDYLSSSWLGCDYVTDRRLRWRETFPFFCARGWEENLFPPVCLRSSWRRLPVSTVAIS